MSGILSLTVTVSIARVMDISYHVRPEDRTMVPSAGLGR
jgi:hypothetical protein